MTHKHHCPHGSWTCSCDIANGKSTRGTCGTCLRIGMDTHDPLAPRTVADRRQSGKSPIADKPVKLGRDANGQQAGRNPAGSASPGGSIPPTPIMLTCVLCDAEFEPALSPVRAVPLCGECVKKIEDQLTKGRFLG